MNVQKRFRAARKMNLFTTLAELRNYDSLNHIRKKDSFFEQLYGPMSFNLALVICGQPNLKKQPKVFFLFTAWLATRNELKKKHPLPRHPPQTKSSQRSPAMGDFYGTRIEIWAGFGLVRQLLRPVFSCFHGQKFFLKNILDVENIFGIE